MKSNGWAALVATVGLIGLPVACNKKTNVAPDPAASGTVAAPVAASAAALPAASAPAPLSGLDACLIGQWKGTRVSMKSEQASAEGGANLGLQISPSGDSVLDLSPMAPIKGTAAGASFEFRYSGKATATLTTPARGVLGSSKSDYSALRVTANVDVPGAGKIALLKDKPMSELAQMAAGIAGAKAPGTAPANGAPRGIDSSPVFSNTRYTCEGDTLTLHGGAQALEWVFARVSK